MPTVSLCVQENSDCIRDDVKLRVSCDITLLYYAGMKLMQYAITIKKKLMERNIAFETHLDYCLYCHCNILLLRKENASFDESNGFSETISISGDQLACCHSPEVR